LILEKEYRAYKRAEQKADIVRISNGLAEIIYSCIGAALEYGIPINRIFSEVHRAKICEEVPHIAEILAKEMYGETEERNDLLIK
jgi:predicted HAD superfamily Cof-like phosphohydrolase